jgi:uncharacterized protein YndB with AHSA1/START domain
MTGKTNVVAPPNSQSVTITREFEAPRELVFKAFTDPELIAQWWGPRDLGIKIEAYEPRAGGSWRFIHTAENGDEFPFHGVIHDMTRPERIIQTFEFEGLPESGHVSLETSTFEALPGQRTKVTTLVAFQTVQDRDGMVNSGMEGGLSEGYERMDELLAQS